MDAGRERDSVDSDESQSRLEAKKSKRVAMAVFAGLTCVLLISVFYSPATVDATGQYFTVCGFKALTGLPCPGCGLTHSFCALGKGDLREGFAFNAIGPPLFFVSILIWIRFLFVMAGVKKPVELWDQTIDHTKLIQAFAVALGLFGVARIVYVVIWQSAGVQDSPLMRLMQRILT